MILRRGGSKLSPRYVGPYPIVERVGPVAYRLALAAPFEGIHDVFHVSRLRKHLPDPESVEQVDDLPILGDLSYEEYPVQIIGHDIRELRRKRIPMVKVLWNRHRASGDATWETEESMRKRYPHLFQGMNLGTKFF